MYNLLFVIGFAEGADTAARDAFTAKLSAFGGTAQVRNATIQPTLPGVYNGGDLICRFVFDDDAALTAATTGADWAAIEAGLADKALVASLERVEYEGGLAGGSSDGTKLYRVALFCANVSPTEERLAAFGRQTASMPRYIKAIRRWQVSSTVKASGLNPWTHVWEQEYDGIEGLNGPYMMHPAHWAHVERWFDTEYPDYLVDRVLVHTFCAIDAPVIIA
ncbi:Stress responsive A/B Barrel Domain [Sphingomonas laterariae]|uniref:Stress responsive A/B Barrel Domain n=1 Tax=Edaphosphingomonas laterariae TaxID=861865 RepID=A0A239HZ97_9SPHN|nr:Dabb family protein [Sphingomonas laterariae]SNS86816.1 Stress responsive A/B Barrel Domain [Sphingomonas laterariae]